MARIARRTKRAIAIAVGAAVIWLATAALAQGVRAANHSLAHATLPESNEALLITSRIDDALKVGDHRLALELVERLKDTRQGVVASPVGRTYYPVWRQALRVMDRFPQPAIDLYRRLNDPEVTTRFTEAAAAGDVQTLRELFRNSRLSSVWPEIGVELASRLLDDGLYGEAIETLLELDHANVGSRLETRGQLVAALGCAGAVARAEKLLNELRRDPELVGDQERRTRLDQIDRWLSARSRGPLAGLIEGGRGFEPALGAGAIWMHALATDARAAACVDSEELARAVASKSMLPLHSPVVAGGALALRVGGGLWVYDCETLALRWDAPESLSEGDAEPAVGMAPEENIEPDSRLSPNVESLLRDHLRHAVAIECGLVLTIEGAGFGASETGRPPPLPFGPSPPRRGRNELVARDLVDGRVVWRTGGDPSSALFDVVFQDAPIAIDDTLALPVQRGEELSLAVISVSDGSLTREVPIVGPPTSLAVAGGSCLLTGDETSVYVCTGAGVIAALARDDLSWKWAAVYPSSLARTRGQLWWQPTRVTEDVSVDRPVVVDDLLIAAPLDSEEIFALDRFDGAERWRLPRGEYPFLIGATRFGVILGGQTLVCLDPHDPRGVEPLWESVPLQITGRSVIRQDNILTPTRDGIVVIDGRNGKVTSDQYRLCSSDSGAAALISPSDAPSASANLALSEDAVFSVSPERVVKYPDVALARARCEEAAGSGRDANRTALVRSWLDAFEGEYGAALARLREWRPPNARLAEARERLLTRVYLGLARDADGGDDRLAWLRRAADLSGVNGASASLAVAIGRTLEQAGRWDDALRHYGDMLFQRGAAVAIDPRDSDRRVAQWLYAAGRIRGISGKASGGSLERLVQRVSGESSDSLIIDLASADGAAELAPGLQRLRVALAGHPSGSQADLGLCLARVSPELKIRYFADDNGDTPATFRRRLLLERWDVYASLGLLDQARTDGEEWRARYAAALLESDDLTPAPAYGLTPAEEQRRVAAIELALRKLAQTRGEPFSESVTRQWKAEHAELIIDPRQASGGGDPWLLVADLERRQIQLINSYKRQHAQRQTDDALTNASASSPMETGVPRGVGGARQAWPAAVNGHLAAVPIRGGLVCVGMGPERYAGRRQWEYAVSQWSEPPEDFVERSAAGEHGVYFSPRRDRVVMVGWEDGELWWRRDLPGVAIERLHLTSGKRGADARLLIISDDQRIWAADALDGRKIQRIDTGTATPRHIDVVDETIIVWGPDFVAGIDAATLQRLWTRPGEPLADSLAVFRRPWVAFRTVDEDEWRLLDVATGEPVFDATIGRFDGMSAVVDDGETILAAGLVTTDESEGDRFIMRVAAFRRFDGEHAWTRDIKTDAPLNVTQLTAHRSLIPVLLTPEQPGVPVVEQDRPAIQFVDKRDGVVGEPISIKHDYRIVPEAGCEMSILATSSRIIVQVGGNLIAYGQSPLRKTP